MKKIKEKILSIIIIISLSVTIYSCSGDTISTLTGSSENNSEDPTNTLAGSTGTTGPTYICPDANAILITSADELQNIGSTGSYCISQDIDFTNITFEPIGSKANSFKGTLDGAMHKITGIQIDKRKESNIGLFSEIGSVGTVKNLTIENFTIEGKDNVGPLVGTNLGTIDNVKAENNSTKGKYRVGGLVGQNDAGSTITNSYANGTIKGKKDVGGLVGENKASITKCYVDVTVMGNPDRKESEEDIGGLVGENEDLANIADSYAMGEISVDGKRLGGLVGHNTGNSTIVTSYAIATVSGNSTELGSLLGQNDQNATIENSYFDKSVNTGIDGVGAGDQTGVTGIESSDITDNGEKPFIDNGWDFADIWKAIDGQWPELAWQQ